MIEVIIALLLGSVIGIVTGIVPGLHPNTLIPLMLGLSVIFGSQQLALILIFAGVINSFVSFIPAILIGTPEDDTALSVLPGHKLLFEGRGYEAIRLTAIGGLSALLVSLALLPLLLLFFPILYSSIRPFLWALLSVFVIYMVLSERHSKVYASCIVLFSGALGLIVLNGFGSVMLFPMLCGLFGLPVLLLNSVKEVSLQHQTNFDCEVMPRAKIFTSALSGSLAGILVGLLPGIGSAQASVVVQSVLERGKLSIRKFLIAIGGVTTADIIYSVFALWLIGNPRSGIAAAVGRLIELTPSKLVFITASILIAAIIGFASTLVLSKRLLSFLTKLDYKRLCQAVLGLSACLIFLFSGPFGLLVACVSLLIGLLAMLTGVRRSHAMACLLLPTIIYFL